MRNAGTPTRIPADDEHDEKLLWIGPDHRGVELEVIGIELTDLLLIIHAMPHLPEDVMTNKDQTPAYVLDDGPYVDLEHEDVRDSHGRRITQAYVDAAVTDVHDRIGPGRPSLTGRASRSPQVTFRLPPELRAQAEAQAAREGGRVSDVAREALEEYLARHTAS